MSADTLTDAQARTLGLMRDAAKRGIPIFAGGNDASKLAAHGMFVNQATGRALERSGFVAVVRPMRDNWTIEFTSAGREALARHEAGDRRG